MPAGCRRRVGGASRIGLQPSPTISHGEVHGEGAASKKLRQLHFQPIQQPEFALAVCHKLDAFADLSECQHTHKQRGRRSLLAIKGARVELFFGGWSEFGSLRLAADNTGQTTVFVATFGRLLQGGRINGLFY
jgi:hypothetical protein